MFDLQLIFMYGYIGIFIGAILLNLIPFASPSNLIISALSMLILPMLNPIGIATAVAIGASIAKYIHYYASFKISRIRFKDNRFLRYQKIIDKWGFFGAFIAAVTPIPDDPVVIPLGIIKYNFIKFSLSYFSGKFLICLIGTYTSNQINEMIKIFDVKIAIISVMLSIVVITILLKMSHDNDRYKPRI